MKERKEFSREFKLEAIRQLEEGRKNPAELARELGIRRNQLYKWKEMKESAAGRPFPGSGHRARKGSEAEEIARLRREVEQLRQENEILKKAAAFFARELKRIHAELVDHGEQVGKNTVARLMRRERIQSKVHRRFVVTTDSRHTKTPAENILARDFAAFRANEKWVSDVTFIPTRKGWLYVALIMDLYSRRIVGWSVFQRKDIRGVLLRSDQGVQYASGPYQQLLSRFGIVSSMSRKGNCWDNAPMESFFHSLKTECVGFEDYRSRDEARVSLFD